MRASPFLWLSGVLSIGCAGATPLVSSPSGPSGTPVSPQLHGELTSVADELSYEDPCPLRLEARNTGYDECMVSFDCTYCRMRGGWWMLQRCSQTPAREATIMAPPKCDVSARCGLLPG